MSPFSRVSCLRCMSYVCYQGDFWDHLSSVSAFMCEVEPRRVNWAICLRVTPHPPPPPKLLSCSPVSSMRSPKPHPLLNLTQVPPSFVTFLHFLFNYTFILLGSIHLVLHQSRKRGHTKKRFVPSDLRYRGGWRPKIAANQRISDK